MQVSQNSVSGFEADKIYRSKEFTSNLQDFDSKIITPIKLEKNQDKLSFYQQTYSTLGSVVRQLCEYK